jgi:hypothetical protein
MGRLGLGLLACYDSESPKGDQGEINDERLQVVHHT